MNKQVRYSAVPVGATFIYKYSSFIKSSMGRARFSISGTPNFKRFKKHEIVEWVNAPTDQIGR